MEEHEEILERLLGRYPALHSARTEILAAFQGMRECFLRGGKLLVCGNGGSSADAQHMVGELMKEFRRGRGLDPDFAEECRKLYPGEGLEKKLQPALPAIALGTNQAFATAYANDVCPEMVYAQEVFAYGRKGDVLLGFSTSGNSENVINAVKVARARKIVCIGAGGRSGGRLRALCDIYVELPAKENYLVQELTLPLYHAWCEMLESAFWPGGAFFDRDKAEG